MSDSGKKIEVTIVAERPSLAREFWIFLRENKKWWLLPIIIVIFLMGALILFVNSPAAPLIYTIF